MAKTPQTTKRKRTKGASSSKVAGKGEGGGAATRGGRRKGSSGRSKKGSKGLVPVWMRSMAKKNWKSWTTLLSTFFMALFLRTYFYYQRAFKTDPPQLSGNDPFYHKRVVDFVQENYFHLKMDSMLNYPLGLMNPRPPVFDWSIAITGMAISPFFGGDIGAATWFTIEFAPSFWGALAVFPVFFLARDMFGSRAGYIAAFLIAITPSNIERSPLGFSDHDSMVVFFVITTFFFLSRAYGNIRGTRWVDNWLRPADITDGMMSFLETNRIALLYAMLSGFSLAAIALMWEGFGYVVVIIMVCYLVQLIFNRFRNVDSMGIMMATLAALFTAMLVALPYYLFYSINTWMNPFVIVLAIVVAGLFIIPTRDFPWIMILPMLLAMIISAYYLLNHFAPDIAENLFTGGGYFVKSKLYSTIAEAQAPDMSRMIFSYGPVTYFLTFIGLVMAAISIPKHWRSDYILIIVWSGVAVFMAVSAVRFMFNATPVFAIMGGWVLSEIIERTRASTGLKQLDGDRWYVHFYIGISTLLIIVFTYQFFYIQEEQFWLFEFMSMVGLFLVFTTLAGMYLYFRYDHRLGLGVIILVPLLWYVYNLWNANIGEWNDLMFRYSHVVMAIAIIPGLLFLAYHWQSRRTAFEFRQVLLGFFVCVLILLPNGMYAIDAAIPYEDKAEFDPDREMTGSFGHSFTSEYWLDGMNWLSEQDANLTYEERPAFISWWDYGFWCAQIGQHPTAADNFQSGYHFAGSVISSQNETQAISLMITRLLEGFVREHQAKLTPDMEAVLIEHLDGGDLDNHPRTDRLLRYLTTNREGEEAQDDLIDMVNSDSDRYGKYVTLKYPNAMYGACRELLVELGEEGVVDLYHDVQVVSGTSLRYFAVDSRLFPFSAQNTGIFYAPIKLADRDVNEYLEYMAVTDDGRRLDSEALQDAAERDPELRVKTYELEYMDPFYNSMFYRTYVGYRASDIGLSDSGVPGIVGDMARYPAMQGWNMTHFKLVYRTMYYSEDSEANSSFPDDYTAMESGAAMDLYNNQGGDLKSGLGQGVTFLKYYDGALLRGQVLTEDGKPVPGARVTCQDEFEIPHHSVLSDRDGYYELIMPFGDIRVTISTGGWGDSQPEYNRLAKVESEVLNSTLITVREDQAMRLSGDWIIEQDMHIPSSDLSGQLFWDINGDGSYSALDDDYFQGAVVYAVHQEQNLSMVADEQTTATYTFRDAIPGPYDVYMSYRGRDYLLGADVKVAGDKDSIEDFGITPGNITVNITAFTNVAPDDASGIPFALNNVEGGTSYYGKSDPAGSVHFPLLLPGNYTVELEPGSGFMAISTPVDLKEGFNATLNLTLTKVSWVDGYVYDATGGVPVKAPYAQIQFYGIDNPDDSQVVIADGEGYYSALLVNGSYGACARYNVGKGVLSDLLHMELDPDEKVTVDFALSPTAEINGSVLKLDERVVDDNRSVNVLFIDDATGAVARAPTNITGQYSTDLPPGEYTVRIDHLTSVGRELYSHIAQLDITATGQLITRNIHLSKATLIQGVVYWDRDSDGVPDGYEFIDDRWADDDQNDFTDDNPDFAGPDDDSLAGTRDNGDDDVSGAGGDDGNGNGGDDINGTGDNLFEGPFIDIPLEGAEVVFTGVNGTYTAITNESGYYELNVALGTYTYTFDDPRAYETFRGKITATNLTVNYPPAVNISFRPNEASLEGVLYHDADGDGAASDDETLDMVEITFVGLTPGTVGTTVETDNTGAFTADGLTPGTYRVVSSHVVTEKGDTVNYTFEEYVNLTLEGGRIPWDFNVVKEVWATGRVTLPNGSTAAYASIKLLDGQKDVAFEFIANATGHYNATVEAGDYTAWIQLSQFNDTFVYLRPLTIAPGALALRIVMDPGVKVTGETIVYSDAAHSADKTETVSGVDIHFHGPVDVKAVAQSGNYSAILYPDTNYRVEVDMKTSPKEGAEDSWYTFSGQLKLGSSGTTYDIVMDKAINVSGVLYYDFNTNQQYDEGADDALSNATVTFGYLGLSGTRPPEGQDEPEVLEEVVLITNASGGYQTWLPIGNHSIRTDAYGFDEVPYKSGLNVFAAGVVEDIRAKPLDVLVNITAYSDADYTGELDHGEMLIAAGELTFSNADPEGTSYEFDGMGREFQVAIAPGTYYVYGVNDRTAQGGLMRLFFGSVTFEKGEHFDYDMGYTLGANLRGPVVLIDTYENKVLNVTALASEDYGEGGLQIKSKGGSTQGNGQTNIDVIDGWWEMKLPYSEYTMRLDITRQELQMDIDYGFSTDITADVNNTLFGFELVKEKALSVELELLDVGAELLVMAQNDTRTVHLLATNTGNHPNSLEMTAEDLPPGWSVEFDKDTFKLPIDGFTPVNFTLTTSPDALVSSAFSIKAGSTESGGATDKVTFDVRVPVIGEPVVTAVEGWERGVCVGGWVGYNVTINNSRNQLETIAINASITDARTEGWDVRVDGGEENGTGIRFVELEPLGEVTVTVEVRTPNATTTFVGDSATARVTINTTGPDSPEYWEFSHKLETSVKQVNLAAKNLRVDNLKLKDGDELNITCAVSASGCEAFDIPVRVYIDDEAVYNASIDYIREGGTARFDFQLNLSADSADVNGTMVKINAGQEFRLVVDPEDTLEESREGDNELEEYLVVGKEVVEPGTNWRVVAFILALAIFLLIVLAAAWRSSTV